MVYPYTFVRNGITLSCYATYLYPSFEETVDSDVYCFIIFQFSVLLEPDEHYCTFQQDGAKLHTSNDTTEFLKPFFDD